jgi:hypothetical protein
MIDVSTLFTNTVKAPVKQPQPGCLISWLKTYDAGVAFAQMDHSHMDQGDRMKGTGDTVTFFNKYDYVNETKYVKNFRIIKKVSNKPWGVIMATAEIELNNTTKRFFPGLDPTIGDYTDLPDRPVKLSVGFNGEYINLFTGYTERPGHQLLKRVTKLRAYDAMTYLSTVKSSLDAFVDTPANEIIEALLIEQGFGADMFNIESSLQQPIGYLMPNGRIVTDILQEICDAEGYIIHADEEGVIQGWNRLHMLGDRTPVWTFTYANMVDINFSSAPIINAAEVVAKPFKPAAWNKLYETDSSVGEDRTVLPGQSKDIFVEFKDDLGSFPAIDVEEPVHISTATGGSYYSTNLSKDGDADTGAADITLDSVYNFGNTYRMTFSNTGDVPIYVTKIVLFGQPAKVTAIKGDTQEDATSIEKYGINPDNNKQVYVIENNLVQDLATANTMAWLLVDINSGPHARLDVDNFVVPQLQFGDPVQVDIMDTEESKYCNVLGTELFFGVDANLTHKIYLEERELKTYARMDQSHMDGDDVMAL